MDRCRLRDRKWNHLPPAITGIAKVPDPLSGFWGSTPSCAGVGGSKGNKSYSSGTVAAGCYGNLSVSGNAALSAGLYVIQGALNITTSAAATGVTFYVDGANGGSVSSLDATLTAPSLASPASCSAGGGCRGMDNCPNATQDQIQTYVRSLHFGGIDSSKLQVQVTWAASPQPGATCTSPCNDPGDQVQVEALYPLGITVPFVPMPQVTVHSTAETVIAQ